ncbi:hypothetical protein, partial [Haematobacter massiliensis]|uniref:hypothetical protein n=1 Tax=Haematobacter massiliensis TaxID=195105 RepID=UPI001C3D1DE3
REAMVKLSTLRETRLLWGRDAARRIWAMLGMPDVATPGDSARGPAATAAEPSLEAFLSDCFEVTGNPRDRVYPPEMWQRYQDWAEAVCAPPLGHRTFSLRLAALVANWRCPRTGRRISRMKSGTTLYSGLRPMDVTP